MAEKRKRGHNFSIEEKDRLVKIIGEHRSTILNKKTDGTTNEAGQFIYTNGGPSDIQITQTSTPVSINKENTPLWSRRRRPRLISKNERSDALQNITTSLCNVHEKKLTYEELKVQLVADEKKFKDKLYALQLEAAKKDLAIKEEILKQLQGGGLSSDNIIGLGRKKTNED